MKISDFDHIYFACTGNTCRSPLAQRIFQEKLLKRGAAKPLVSSRRAAVNDEHSRFRSTSLKEEISDGVATLIINHFADQQFVVSHRACAFSERELDRADLVLTMEPAHCSILRKVVQAYTPDARVKVYTLGEILSRPAEIVVDPMLPGVYSPRFSKGSRFQSLKEDDYPFTISRPFLPMTDRYQQTFNQLDSLLEELFALEITLKPMRELLKQEIDPSRLKSEIESSSLSLYGGFVVGFPTLSSIQERCHQLGKYDQDFIQWAIQLYPLTERQRGFGRSSGGEFAVLFETEIMPLFCSILERVPAVLDYEQRTSSFLLRQLTRDIFEYVEDRERYRPKEKDWSGQLQKVVNGI